MFAITKQRMMLCNNNILSFIAKQNIANPLYYVFRTSAVAIHPTTKDIFVLSSLNNMIAVLSPENGRIKRIIELVGPDYNQPEGLAFGSDGRLYVSNESNGKIANIIRIIYE